jgi:hypothetical protein
VTDRLKPTVRLPLAARKRRREICAVLMSDLP